MMFSFPKEIGLGQSTDPQNSELECILKDYLLADTTQPTHSSDF